MFNKKVIVQEPIVEEEIEDTKIKTSVVEFISETIKRSAANQTNRKPEDTAIRQAHTLPPRMFGVGGHPHQTLLGECIGKIT